MKYWYKEHQNSTPILVEVYKEENGQVYIKFQNGKVIRWEDISSEARFLKA